MSALTTLLSLGVLQLSGVRQAVRPHLDLLLPLFFVGFFLAAAVALFFNRKPSVRRTYLAGLFALLLVANTAGVTVLPLTHWQKFADGFEQNRTVHEIRVVDAGGRELHYDHRSTLSVDGVTIFVMQRELAEGSREERVERARYLLERAVRYRDRIESRSPLRYLRFPPHGLDNIWTPGRLDGYARFVGIRLYRLDVVTTADGTALSSVSETLVMEYVPDDRSTAAAGNGNRSATTDHRRPGCLPCS